MGYCVRCGCEYECDCDDEEIFIPLTPDQQEAARIRTKEAIAQFEAERLRQPLYCSFCGNTGIDLVRGPSVYICLSCAVAATVDPRPKVRFVGDL